MTSFEVALFSLEGTAKHTCASFDVATPVSDPLQAWTTAKSVVFVQVNPLYECLWLGREGTGCVPFGGQNCAQEFVVTARG